MDILKERLGRLNRKGQEGVTLTTLLLIILGIVVVVIIIIGATQGFDFFFGKIGQLPGQSLQAAVSACEIAGETGLKADYCSQFRKVEINGEEQYVTCDFLEEGKYLSKTLDAGCGDLKVEKTDAVIYCSNQKLKENMKVDGFVCGTDKLNCEEFAGSNEQSANDFDKGGCDAISGSRIIKQELVDDVSEGQVCCVYPNSS